MEVFSQDECVRITGNSGPIYGAFLKYFCHVNVDLPSKQLIKQSHDKVRHHYDTPFTALIRLLFT